jgi:hypothetical protein
MESADKCCPCSELALSIVGKCLFFALAEIELRDGATVMFWAGAYLLGIHHMDIPPNLTPYQQKDHPVHDLFANGENITDVWEHITANVIS